MLIKCPECELQVSDKAVSCPHCGYPLKEDTIKSTKKRRTNKRRRLPNGFGQISELKNQNLRKPFRAMVTVGKTSTGRPISKLLKPDAYFETYNEAYAALVEYNKNPYDLEPDITLKELYDEWSKKRFPQLNSKGSIRSIESSWKYCSDLYDIRVKDIRIRHIKGCLENGTVIVHNEERHPSDAIKGRIKSIFNQLLDYGIEKEIIEHNYAKDFTLGINTHNPKNVKNNHVSFTNEEMQILWGNADKLKYVDMLIIQCYSGWRPQELVNLKIKNVNLDEWTFEGGMKTSAGFNRVVPIHSKIRDLVKKNYIEAVKLNSDFLFNYTESYNRNTTILFNYDKYSSVFKKIIKALNINPEHRPHDCRKHFVTISKRNNVDEYAIKYLIGHVITDITESVYTDRDLNWLRNEIEKIK